MQSIIDIPAFIKILTIFSFILLMGKTKIPFGLTLFIASIGIGIWFKTDATLMLLISFKAATGITSILLMITVFLIIFFSGYLKKTGIMEHIVGSLDTVIKKTKYKLIALPALIGLLPMPGGALFSAPMVESVAKEKSISNQRKTNINYFFRHIWEPVWPLYPGVLLFASLTKNPLTKLIIANSAVVITMVLTGYIFLLHNLKIKDKSVKNKRSYKLFIKNIFPILLIFITITLFSIIATFLPIFKNILTNKYSAIITGLIVSTIYLMKKYPLPISETFKIAFGKKSLDICFMVMGVIAFKTAMETSGAISGLRYDLEYYNMPITLMVLTIPFFTGIVFGIMFGTIGASFPIIIPLIQQSTLAGNSFFYFTIAYASAFTGMMLSPVHICLMLTKEYFNTSYLLIYKKLIPAITTNFILWFIILLIVSKFM